MNFNEWQKKYCPEITDQKTLDLMSMAYASGHVNMASQLNGGVGLIADERIRQIEEKGWTKEYDSQHPPGDLAGSGAAYALDAAAELCRKDGGELGDGLYQECADVCWRWDEEWWKPTHNDLVHQLAKAGAMIAAEIDKIQES